MTAMASYRTGQVLLPRDGLDKQSGARGSADVSSQGGPGHDDGEDEGLPRTLVIDDHEVARPRNALRRRPVRAAGFLAPMRRRPMA